MTTMKLLVAFRLGLESRVPLTNETIQTLKQSGWISNVVWIRCTYLGIIYQGFLYVIKLFPKQ